MEQSHREHNRAAPLPADIDFDLHNPSSPPEDGFLSPAQAQKPELTLIEETEQQKWDHYVYDSVLEIGMDLYEAMGGRLLTPYQFKRLRQNQMVDFDINEVLRIFDDEWDFVQADIAEASRIRRTETERAKQNILRQIAQERLSSQLYHWSPDGPQSQRSNPLPPQLFKKVKTESRIKITDKGKEEKVRVAVLTAEDVSEVKQIQRYTRFVVARTLLESKGVDVFDLQAAAAGTKFNASYATEGTAMHSYLAQLQNLLGEEDIEYVKEKVEYIASSYGWTEFVFPRDRGTYLKVLRKVCTQPKDEERAKVYDPAEIIAKLPDELPAGAVPTFYYDTKKKKIIEGDDVLQAYINAGAQPTDIANLGYYLRYEEVETELSDYPEIDYTVWDRERYIKFGRWITRIVAPPVQPKEKVLNKDVLKRARAIGLGPSRRSIIIEFGNMSNFYREAEAAGSLIKGSFDDWTIDDFVEYLRNLGHELGRRPTVDDIENAATKSPSNPNRNLMYERFKEEGGINMLLELAGFVVIPRWKPEDYISWGVRVMRANEGKKLTDTVIAYFSERQLGPSRRPITRIFPRGLKGFQDRVMQELELQMEDSGNRDPRVGQEHYLRVYKLGEEFEAYHRKKMKLLSDRRKQKKADEKNSLKYMNS